MRGLCGGGPERRAAVRERDPLCVIDAVFSIGVRYSGTRQVVIRYCDYTQQRRVRDGAELPPIEDQESISEFCARPEQADPDGMAGAVYGNRQRASSRRGILKAEAAYRFAAVPRNHGVEQLQGMARFARNTALEEDFKAIPWHPSGIASRYLFMLAGQGAFVKPDRKIQRFIEAAIGRKVPDPAGAADLVAVLTITSN